MVVIISRMGVVEGGAVVRFADSCEEGGDGTRRQQAKRGERKWATIIPFRGMIYAESYFPVLSLS